VFLFTLYCLDKIHVVPSFGGRLSIKSSHICVIVLLSKHPVRFQDPTHGTVVYTGEQDEDDVMR